MDAGDCYILPNTPHTHTHTHTHNHVPTNKKNYLKIVPFNIASAHERDSVQLSIRSNLANQILIYADKNLSIRAENVPLPPKREVHTHCWKETCKRDLYI